MQTLAHPIRSLPAHRILLSFHGLHFVLGTSAILGMLAIVLIGWMLDVPDAST
jgi:hypothetical protein